MNLNFKSNEFRIGIIGAGAWGTAIARFLCIKGCSVKLWCHQIETANDINTNHLNSHFLPNIQLPESLEATNELKEIVKDYRIIASSLPSQVTRKYAKLMNSEITEKHILVILSKGIEQNSLALISEIFEEELDNLPKIEVVSGPTFAQEVAMDLPSAALLACKDKKTRNFLQKMFHSKKLRIYLSEDIIGAQLGGAIKNVIAIASGIADGMQLGFNARATLICRGVAEMSKLGLKMGGAPETFSGISGVGDLILTATGKLSRNYSLGFKLGQGIPLKKCLNQNRKVVEGFSSAISINNLSKIHKIEMPICNAVFQVLYEGISCAQSLQWLLERNPPDEEIINS